MKARDLRVLPIDVWDLLARVPMKGSIRLDVLFGDSLFKNIEQERKILNMCVFSGLLFLIENPEGGFKSVTRHAPVEADLLTPLAVKNQ